MKANIVKRMLLFGLSGLMLLSLTACGGNKYRALDIMFANKFVRKLNNNFDEGISENLDKLVELIDASFGKDNFVESIKQVALIKKKLY